MTFPEDVTINIHFEPAGGTEYDVYINDECIGTLDTATEKLRIERVTEEARDAFIRPVERALRKKFPSLTVDKFS